MSSTNAPAQQSPPTSQAAPAPAPAQPAAATTSAPASGPSSSTEAPQSSMQFPNMQTEQVLAILKGLGPNFYVSSAFDAYECVIVATCVVVVHSRTL